MSRPRLVTRHTPAMLATPTAPATPSRTYTEASREPNIFWRRHHSGDMTECTVVTWRSTLAVNTKVRVTQATRGRLASPDWGEAAMNSRSLRQSRRQLANSGSRQPLNTCAIRMT